MGNNAVNLSVYNQQQNSERDSLIIKHLPQIRYIAQRIAMRVPPGVQLDDLVSAGVIGLLDAVEKFDKDKGVKFKTYAEVRIRGAILDSLRGLDWAPRSLRKKSKEVEQIYARLEQELGRAANDDEVADALGISLGDFQNLLEQLNRLNIGSFQLLATDADGQDQDEIPMRYMPASDEDSPFDLVSKGEMRETLAGAIRQLPEREQLVISLYYYEELTMKEIGKILGVNESRVSQLHTRCMLRLRGKLKNVLRG